MPPTKGGNASNQGSRSVGSITAPKAEARAIFTKRQKKGAVPPAPSSTHCPFTEEATEGSLGVHLLVVAITTKRILGSATQEKAEVPPSALFDAFISYG